MPKHIIHSRYHGTAVRVLSPDGKDEYESLVEPFLHVGWTKDGEHVEVATQQGGDYKVGERPGFFVQLGRGEINDLIRSLRRARDAAYGTDA